MGAVLERQLVVGQRQLGDYAEHIEQPERWRFDGRFNFLVTEHERPIERKRQLIGHEQLAELIEPELWHQHLVAEHERSIERHDERRAAELHELQQQHEVIATSGAGVLPAPCFKIREWCLHGMPDFPKEAFHGRQHT